MIFQNPKYEEILYVMQNLRPSSYEEAFGTMDDENAELAARYISGAKGFKWVFYYDGMPTALMGALYAHKGVYSLFGYGTDNWQKVWREVTRVGKREMFEAVKAAGAHRAQCVAPITHTEGHRWMRFLGATEEHLLKKYGKNEQDYLMFSWVKGA